MIRSEKIQEIINKLPLNTGDEKIDYLIDRLISILKKYRNFESYPIEVVGNVLNDILFQLPNHKEDKRMPKTIKISICEKL